MIGWAIAGGATAAGALNVWIFAKAWLKDRRTRRRVFELLDKAHAAGYFGMKAFPRTPASIAFWLARNFMCGVDIPSVEHDVYLWMTEKGLL